MTGAEPVDVLVLGGGVAALEAVLALRDLAGARVRTTVVAPESDFTYRPMTVTEPFTLGRAERHELAAMARELGVELIRDAAVEIVPDRRAVRLAGGREVSYDALVVAVGARAAAPFTDGITFGMPGSAEALEEVLADVEAGAARRLAFVLPGGSTWPLPIYELALMTAEAIRAMGGGGEIALVSTEPAPLSVFGGDASAEIAALLREAGVEFCGATHAAYDGRELWLSPQGRQLAVDRVVTLPVLLGPALRGLPGDTSGFVPTDAHGRVAGLEDVYAAGDATTSPVKQGGIAAQQADAVARTIAARAGAKVTNAAAPPVLRGLLLTGSSRHFFRHALAGRPRPGVAVREPLWWPPTKTAGRYLSPYLYGRTESELLRDRPAAATGMTIDFSP